MKKSLKICRAITAGVLLLVLITFLILYFTVLKPKQPKIVASPIGLDHIAFSLPPNPTLNISIRAAITIENPNYAGFQYRNSSATVFYRRNLIGDAPIEAGVIRARSTKNISTVINVDADKLMADSSFLPDVLRGSLNLTSTAIMEGKVILLGIFKIRATIYSSCDISIFVWEGTKTSICDSKIEL
ncbi:hypothetical protein KSP39_PZI009372 [Platanthera zijinensis]|uniref:Late embryogenesis abundant protein LEA-2 subgroup domain-containing protein n=1 Tax=Platanthera zijinensis TaxID=2320716 RepID=A0AAP0BK58_9ASPA